MAKKRRKKNQQLPTASSVRSPGGKSAWRLMDRAATIASGLLATRVAAVAWRGVTGRAAPTLTRHPDVSTREAVAWAVVGGALVELVKMLIRRGVAVYWVRSTGDLPPGMKPLAKTTGPAPKEPVPSATSGRRGKRQ